MNRWTVYEEPIKCAIFEKAVKQLMAQLKLVVMKCNRSIFLSSSVSTNASFQVYENFVHTFVVFKFRTASHDIWSLYIAA